MSRRRKWTVAGLVVLLAALAAAALTIWGRGPGVSNGNGTPAAASVTAPTSAPAPDRSVVTSKKLTSEVVTALATDLTSGVTADVDGAIAAPPEWTPSAETVAQFDARFAPGLPARAHGRTGGRRTRGERRR